VTLFKLWEGMQKDGLNEKNIGGVPP